MIYSSNTIPHTISKYFHYHSNLQRVSCLLEYVAIYSWQDLCLVKLLLFLQPGLKLDLTPKTLGLKHVMHIPLYPIIWYTVSCRIVSYPILFFNLIFKILICSKLNYPILSYPIILYPSLAFLCLIIFCPILSHFKVNSLWKNS